MQSNLIRHLKTVHKEEDKVKQAKDAPTQIERDQLFDKIRKCGIFEYNKKLLMAGKKESIIRERSKNCENDEDAVFCSTCLGFYSKTYFTIHRRKCNINTDSASVSAQPIRSEVLSNRISVSKEFEAAILSKFNKNEIGDFCRKDPTIITFGSIQFEKIHGRQDKKVEVKRSVMADMRRLGHLFMIFKKKYEDELVVCDSPSDMLRRQNISILKEAIETYSDGGNDSVKWGLKNALYYLIVNFATMHKTSCLIQEKSGEYKQIEEFLEIFKLYQHAWFGDARYNLTRNRQIKLRRPQELPSEKDVEKVKQYTVQKIRELLEDKYLMWSSKEYIELRDLVASRLILFNARRAGEPSRLTVSEWEDAENGVWLNPQRQHEYDEADAAFFENLKLTFQGGKGNKLVSVYFPDDCTEALRKLANNELRQSLGILDSNKYLFPCFHDSAYHIYGWNAVHKVCTDAGVENIERLTATKMRHRASTIYAATDVPEKDRELFYKHMGHSKEINQHVYQVPLVEASILKVGKQLMNMDGGHGSMISSRSQVHLTSSSLASDVCVASSSTSFSNPTGSEVAELIEVSRIEPSVELEIPHEEKKSKASYTNWTSFESKKLLEFFSDSLEQERIPSKPQILLFKEKFPEIEHTWSQIRTKLDNEKRKRKKSCKEELKRMKRS